MGKKKMYKHKKQARLTTANRKARKELGEEELAFLIACLCGMQSSKYRCLVLQELLLVPDDKFLARFQNSSLEQHLALLFSLYQGTALKSRQGGCFC